MSENEKVELLLVDGSALLHRAYHAYPKMNIRSGKLVNAVYGFASMFISAIDDISPEYVCVAWDVGKPTFRHEMYVAYKAHRKKTDQELIDQVPLVYEMLDAFGVKQVSKEGFEADDLIGSGAEKYKSGVDEVVILTGDQDLMQLVKDKVSLLVPARGSVPAKQYRESEVLERYGVRADQIVDYKALIGDSSDNIPGVVGVGPKTASMLLNKFDSLDGIYKWLDNTGDVSGSEVDGVRFRVVEMLRDSKDSAYLSRDLSEIKVDMEMDGSLEEMLCGEFGDRNELREFFEKMSFKSLSRRVFGDEKKDDIQMGLF